jgi:pimeloyl-ACP methyl ester carboxylesterase
MIFLRHERGLPRAIGYEVHGEGPAVLFLHPFPFDRRLWREVWTGALLVDFRLVSIDARGFGDSALGEPGYSVDDLAEDAVALLDHLGIPMAAAVGCSLGGYVALSLAARHPARLSALALLATRAGADGEAARGMRDAAIAEIRTHGVTAYLDGVATRLCGRSADDAIRANVQRLAETCAPDLVHALPAMMTALRDRPDRTTLLPQLRLPALVVAGAEDTVAPSDEARALHVIPGARGITLPACGHLSPVEQPDALRAALETFLGDELLPRD